MALGKASANQATEPIEPSFWDGAYAGILPIGAVRAVGPFKPHRYFSTVQVMVLLLPLTEAPIAGILNQHKHQTLVTVMDTRNHFHSLWESTDPLALKVTLL